MLAHTIGPGPILAEWLADMGLSPRVAMAAIFADRDHRAQAAEQIEQIIAGAPLSESVAEWLAALPGAPTKQFWLALETNYRNGLAAGLKDCGSG